MKIFRNTHLRFVHTSVYLQKKPSELYDQRVKNGELINDSHQRQIIQNLDDVYNSLEDYTPPSNNMILKFFGRLKVPPNGLYMHGSVGCGKTMLMDLFFHCCSVSIHYYITIT